ncbi:hypothetical protein ARMSODRAFT_1003808 [Armillaria solidipes]|uniref:Uncharacterized protein n=1 Tax=Armillaria solidipes TaxID=1076256 RepID=A0A2H3BHD5_9AGAR|nr:hypothetical protein ARMSODRAFT_1003808 [Armillaria solidipes]
MPLPVNVSEKSFNHNLPRSYDHSMSSEFEAAFSSRIVTPSLASKIGISYHPQAKSPSKDSEELASLVDEMPAYMMLDGPIPSQYSTMVDHQWWQLPAISPRTRDQEPLPPIRTILGHALDLSIPINGHIRYTRPFAIAMGGANRCRPPFPGPLSLSDKPPQSQHNVVDSQRADTIIGTPDSSPRHGFSGPAYMDGHAFASPPTSPLEEIQTPHTTPENGRRMSVIDRYEELLSDVQITEFDEHGAKCRVCEKVVRLGPTNTYTLGPWDRHKKSCRGSRVRRGRGFDDLTSSDITEAMEERYHLMGMHGDAQSPHQFKR